MVNAQIFKRAGLILIASAFFISGPRCFADTLVSSTGSNTGYYSIGGAFPEYLGVTWSQSIASSNVQISASIFSDPFSPAYLFGTAYLTTQVGPGTTSTSAEVARTDFALPTYNPPSQPFVLFSGLTLGPGTYYLLVGGPQNAQGSAFGWVATNAPVVSAGTGISSIRFLEALGNGLEPAYGPALSVFTPSATPLLTITSATSVPEVSSSGLLLVGCLWLIGMSLVRIRASLAHCLS